MSAKLSSLALLTAGALFAAAGHANAQPYPGFTYTDLGALPDGDDSYANAINSAGQVVGFSTVAGYRHATLWNGTTATDLGILPGGGDYSEAWAINDQGQVAGSSWSSTNDTIRATVWNGTTATDLGTLPGADASYARAINDSGQVAGWASTEGSTRAALWNGTTATDLGTLGGGSSVAYAINNDGQVAGQSALLPGSSTSHATVWSGTTPADLGTLPGGDDSAALAINDLGQAAGRSTFLPGSFAYHATVWNGTTPTDLGTLGGDYSEANAINNAGLVVGWADTLDNGTSATLWDGTTATDLNNFLDESMIDAGWVLTGAADINDRGLIVGEAFNNLTYQTHAFLLTPIPEPETYAMFLAGLALMGGVVSSRRRKTAQ
ncbi:MAG: DUF3466 family protein [Nitrosospira sp.]|nr:DUF3466 family protein [Nitrosospira sp.]